MRRSHALSLNCKVRISLKGAYQPIGEAGLRPDRLWLFNENEVWETPVGPDHGFGNSDREIEAMAMGGPGWSGTVTAVVRISDRTASAAIYLRAPEERITIAQ